MNIALCHNKARRWSGLAAFVRDTVTDALHHPACRNGATPVMSLLVSRRWLNPESEAARIAARTALASLDHTLREWGVTYAIHQVIRGEPEPATHELRVTVKLQS